MRQALVKEIEIPELEKLVGDYKPQHYSWTAKDEAILRKYYRRVPMDKLAETLGRTRCAINNKAHILGISGERE